jgi:hypothetical protein
VASPLAYLIGHVSIQYHFYEGFRMFMAVDESGGDGVVF